MSSRARRNLLTLVALAGLGAAFVLCAVADEPGEPGALLFAPFVALLAFQYGPLVGAAAGVAAIGLFATAYELAGGDLSPSRFLARLLPMLLLAVVVGRLNERLREREASYHRIVELSAEMICTIDPNSIVTYVNPRAREILGYEPEELVGEHVSRVLDAEQSAGVAERLARRRDGFDEVLAYDIPLRHKDGRQVWGHVNSSPLYDAHGTFLGSLAMVYDITERRRMEDALRERERVLEEAQAIAHIGSWAWDVTEDRVTWSAELYRIFGLEEGGFDASYEGYLQCVHPDDRDAVHEAVQGAYASGEPFRFEHRVSRQDGEVRVLESRGAVFAGPDGRPVRMAGTALDITDRRRAEEALVEARLARRQARELNDSVVQGLVLAKYALDRGDEATAAAMVDSTLAHARRMIDDLLGEADVAPGELRRGAAAGIGD